MSRTDSGTLYFDPRELKAHDYCDLRLFMRVCGEKASVYQCGLRLRSCGLLRFGDVVLYQCSHAHWHGRVVRVATTITVFQVLYPRLVSSLWKHGPRATFGFSHGPGVTGQSVVHF